MMNITPLLVVLAALVTAANLSAQPQESVDTAYAVTYVEVAPESSSRAVTLLREYARACRSEPGSLQVEVLRRRERAGHFALLEAWKDAKALDAHRTAPSVAALRSAVQPLLRAPLDDRLLKSVAAGPLPAGRLPRGAIYVLTHADALPPASRGADLLTPLAEASRREPGNIRFDVTQQAARLNHFTVIEVWRNERALDAHAGTAHSRGFREKFLGITGSLYDERLYTRIE